MKKKVLIVGGVAGGASAAARLRRLDENAEIVMFERGPYISFANCGLPYYVGGSIAERSKLVVQTPEAMNSRFNIDIRTESDVVSIDEVKKKVVVHSKERGQYEESYDALILSPGAKPIVPPLPGITSSKIYSLRNIPDVDKIKAKVTEQNTSSAVVIGGGFIGIEMAENLREAGIAVTLIEAGPQILAPFDQEMSNILAKELEEQQIQLIFSDRVEGFEETERGITVKLGSGKQLHADMVLLAIGVTPDTGFVKNTSIELGPRGHIVVNDHMRTNVPDVYAVGDAVEVVDFVNGSKTAVPLAGPANKQGRIAADNIGGIATTYKGTQGTSIIKVFGLTGAATGNNEKTLQRLNIPYKVAYVHPNSRASYYPGATPMTMKLLFNSDGKVLGAQAIGYDGVDKRIDSIATVIRFGGTVTDLTELELAYAPPYSSAKDPVNMVGYVAENIVTGLSDVFVVNDLANRDKHNSILVDVRSPIEYSNGYIEGAINIPVDELRGRVGELDKNKEIWVYCQVGLRGYTASRILGQLGYKVKNLSGGYKSYVINNFKPQQYKANTPSTPSSSSSSTTPSTEIVTLDACGLSCPGPLMQVKQQMDTLENGQMLKVTASDPGFYEDIKAWATMTSNSLVERTKRSDGVIEATLTKGNDAADLDPSGTTNQPIISDKNDTTMVVFSGELDKAIASFIIANGAASSGKKVTMFFTFWGLNIIRKPNKIKVEKGFMGKMFEKVMPRGSGKLPLSNLNMMGMGPKMIRSLMKSNNVLSLEQLIQAAQKQGVEMIACQMSMDLMGIHRDELIDGIDVAGVGYYLGQTEKANHNLFI
ncbi:NADPH-dependent 2,4-dienoyl-CoA reductase/sulfur reductase-like enzyme/peroxiredoxin family protein/rhodanese-related sulfurtransferase/TusA-related sulfurtransferase [Paenibacillus turicensis]|uniref:NADPH-dependent 2,4-dienoyl-CoA reductase/sulfur reductase-like enzyme/peroxiredoxin family protein/rhodanese-related sulfurtransferase/TusA-related sulfurtransferase n=1 Tax=Paenibacillus turicensis TaxID=160487 RepID=A0ABS4FP95_9BACL|nr:FAD-dependent oxidoreductase [Paenibacillus turicensis]MBP1904399.1 NADPH-dependent 2,4-dienoyl-CoA reductase/sulfur reductase-like enzyme/peroxiredoxin family protein/rhodanese-related sulfurtransferase/TusA-related sulfurtransferase [Paenibacillus turicensis]